MGIINKAQLQIKSGREKVGVNFTGVGYMYQNEKGEIFFNKKEPLFFDLVNYEFDGPIYNQVKDSGTSSKSTTNEKGKTKSKGKFGAGGIALGMATGGASMLVGIGRKKEKGSSKGRSVTKGNQATQEIQKQVEVKSTARISLTPHDNSAPFTLLVVCDSVLDATLSNFIIKKEQMPPQLVDETKTVVEQMKDYKELLDLGILTQEEFDQKKKELMGL